jgi:hypothetical protein
LSRPKITELFVIFALITRTTHTSTEHCYFLMQTAVVSLRFHSLLLSCGIFSLSMQEH